MTINGVKKVLDKNINHSIDDSPNIGVYKSSFSNTKMISDKIKKISKIIKDLKNIKNG